MRRAWTSDDVAILRRMAGEKTGVKPIAIKLNRTTDAVTRKAFGLGITFGRVIGPFFTPDEDAHLKRLVNGPSATWKMIAAKMNRPEASVRKRAPFLGLKKPFPKSYGLPVRLASKPAVVVPFQRACLNCQNIFTPAHDKLYLCKPCKSTTNWKDGQYMVDVL